MIIKDELEKLGITASKSKGQNFLYDPVALTSIAAFCSLPEGANVVEIGPGLGALTERLQDYHDSYIAYEIEPKFCEYLSKKYPKISIENTDIRDVRLSCDSVTKYSVVGNVPYSISSDIVLWILDNYRTVSTATLLLQKQFSERLSATSNTKAYSALSVKTQLYANVELGPVISGNSFHPIANVESQVVKLIFRDNPLYELTNETIFRAIVKSGFGQRRKTLLNSLMSSELFANKSEVEILLNKAAIDPKRRAETLSVKEFVNLSNLYSSDV